MNQHLATRAHQAALHRDARSVDRRIRAFINGESHGEDVLRALYGDVANEPVPERLRALLRP
jgi:anti-sigma factor NepR-like protein